MPVLEKNISYLYKYLKILYYQFLELNCGTVLTKYYSYIWRFFFSSCNSVSYRKAPARPPRAERFR